jgi:hypothetical protein
LIAEPEISSHGAFNVINKLKENDVGVPNEIEVYK